MASTSPSRVTGGVVLVSSPSRVTEGVVLASTPPRSDGDVCRGVEIPHPPRVCCCVFDDPSLHCTGAVPDASPPAFGPPLPRRFPASLASLPRRFPASWASPPLPPARQLGLASPAASPPAGPPLPCRLPSPVLHPHEPLPSPPQVHHREPEQFVLMWTCGAALLLAAYYFTSMPPQNLGHNLLCFLVYVWARTFEGHDVNFMDLFTIRCGGGVGAVGGLRGMTSTLWIFLPSGVGEGGGGCGGVKGRARPVLPSHPLRSPPISSPPHLPSVPPNSPPPASSPLISPSLGPS